MGAYLDPILDGTKLSRTRKIQVMTLDSIVSKYEIKSIDMLKIDVDGYEHEVLLGCKNSFKHKLIKNILLEINPLHLQKKILKKP